MYDIGTASANNFNMCVYMTVCVYIKQMYIRVCASKDCIWVPNNFHMCLILLHVCINLHSSADQGAT